MKGSIGFTCSCFDLLHAGHILMLKDAKEQCDYLIVGLQTDPTLDRPEKNKPIQSLEERKIQLEAVKYVDEIRIYSTEAELRDMLCKIWPSVRILGPPLAPISIPRIYHVGRYSFVTFLFLIILYCKCKHLLYYPQMDYQD